MNSFRSSAVSIINVSFFQRILCVLRLVHLLANTRFFSKRKRIYHAKTQVLKLKCTMIPFYFRGKVITQVLRKLLNLQFFKLLKVLIFQAEKPPRTIPHAKDNVSSSIVRKGRNCFEILCHASMTIGFLKFNCRTFPVDNPQRILRTRTKDVCQRICR